MATADLDPDRTSDEASADLTHARPNERRNERTRNRTTMVASDNNNTVRSVCRVSKKVGKEGRVRKQRHKNVGGRGKKTSKDGSGGSGGTVRVDMVDIGTLLTGEEEEREYLEFLCEKLKARSVSLRESKTNAQGSVVHFLTMKTDDLAATSMRRLLLHTSGWTLMWADDARDNGLL